METRLAPKAHEIMVTGIVLPSDWDEDDALSELVIAGYDGSEFVIAGAAAAGELMKHLHERITAVGRPAFSGRRRFLAVSAYEAFDPAFDPAGLWAD